SFNGLENGDGIFWRADVRKGNLTLLSILDGTSNTYMIGEDVPELIAWNAWAYPNGAIGTVAIPPNTGIAIPPLGTGGFGQWPTRYSFRSRHTGGLQFAMADGSVRVVRESIPLNLSRAFGTIAGGAVLTENCPLTHGRVDDVRHPFSRPGFAATRPGGSDRGRRLLPGSETGHGPGHRLPQREAGPGRGDGDRLRRLPCRPREGGHAPGRKQGEDRGGRQLSYLHARQGGGSFGVVLGDGRAGAHQPPGPLRLQGDDFRALPGQDEVQPGLRGGGEA